MSRKLIIDPVTRIEGHGKVTVNLDDDGNVVDARLHVVEFRGFEKFVQGHPFWEAPMLMQRICGICFVSHHLCGAKVLDDMIGVGAEGGSRNNADGGEDPPSRPLRADAAISRDGIFLSGGPRDDVRDGRRAGAAQSRSA